MMSTKNRSLLVKAVFLIVLAIFLVFVYWTESAKDVPMANIEKKLLKNKYVKEMQVQTPRELERYMQISASDYDGFFYARSVNNLAVDEVLVIKVKSREQLNHLKDAVDNRLKQQTTNYQGYAPKQVSMLKNAKTFTKGNYIFYCVSKKPDSISEDFTDVI